MCIEVVACQLFIKRIGLYDDDYCHYLHRYHHHCDHLLFHRPIRFADYGAMKPKGRAQNTLTSAAQTHTKQTVIWTKIYLLSTGAADYTLRNNWNREISRGVKYLSDDEWLLPCVDVCWSVQITQGKVAYLSATEDGQRGPLLTDTDITTGTWHNVTLVVSG